MLLLSGLFTILLGVLGFLMIHIGFSTMYAGDFLIRIPAGMYKFVIPWNIDYDDVVLSIRDGVVVLETPVEIKSGFKSYISKFALPFSNTVSYYIRESDGWVESNDDKTNINLNLQTCFLTFYGFHVDSCGEIDTIYYIP